MNFNPRVPRIQLPDGLKELLTDISREVLRYQPENIHEFLADYLEAMLATREELQTMHELSIHLFKQYESLNLTMLKENGFDQNQAEKIANIAVMHLQEAIKNSQRSNVQFANKEKVIFDEIKVLKDIVRQCLPTADEACRIRGNLKGCFKSLCENELTRKVADYDYKWVNDTVEKTLDVYRKRRRALVEHTMEDAAMVIQRAYRRYKSKGIGSIVNRIVSKDGRDPKVRDNNAKLDRNPSTMSQTSEFIQTDGVYKKWGSMHYSFLRSIPDYIK